VGCGVLWLASLQDVYALAQAYCRAGSHKRAVHVISEAGLVDRHDKFR
jgi:hypothetical protein